MSNPQNFEPALEGLKTSLQAFLGAARVVQRGMVLDPANILSADADKGVICLVSKGGGDFWNYQGREGDGGDLDVVAVGFVTVSEKSTTADLERAEQALIDDLLAFCRQIEFGNEILSAVVPLSWEQSGGLQLPAGWTVMKLKVRWL